MEANLKWFNNFWRIKV